MNVTNLLLTLYKNINRTGLLNNGWAQSAFVSSYFTYKKYLEDTTAKLVKKYPTLFKNGHILDVGANIGYTSYVFSKALPPPYKVFAFEPEKRNISILKKVAKTYHLDNLIITDAAVGDNVGEIELWQNDHHHADHRILTTEFRKKLNDTTLSIQKIPIVTIDHFLKTQQAMHTVAFIKIDVQGYELAVCRGMEETLLANPDCMISFEYCPSIMEALGYQAQDLINFFEDKNFFFYRVNKQGSLIPLKIKTDPAIQQKQQFKGYFDVFCSKRCLTE